MKNYFKIIRAKQWLKNLIIFLPFITSSSRDFYMVSDLILIFIGFSMVASSTYVINDLIDKESDRFHPVKKERVVLLQNFTEKKIALLIFFLFFSGMIILNQISSLASLISLVYTIFSLSYSLKTKFIKYLDLLSISLFFIIRLYLGGFVINVDISPYTFLYVLFVSIGINSSKKFSILTNGQINKSKVKNFLLKKYSEKLLLMITKVSFIGSTLIYIFWSLDYVLNNTLNFLFIGISLILYVLFIRIFFIETLKSTTEDFVEILFSNKDTSLLLLSFFIINLFIVY